VTVFPAASSGSRDVRRERARSVGAEEHGRVQGATERLHEVRHRLVPDVHVDVGEDVVGIGMIVTAISSMLRNLFVQLISVVCLRPVSPPTHEVGDRQDRQDREPGLRAADRDPAELRQHRARSSPSAEARC
jgi:hypothetical protein